MNLTTILDDCLERLAAGESVAQCLARYPEAAPQLAPMLAAAEAVRGLSAARLSQGQRLRAKVALREELAAQQARGRSAAPLGVSATARWRLAPLAALVAVALFATVAFSAVAASQPGDLTYPVRVAAERAPLWLRFGADRRVAGELSLADRRLSELAETSDGHRVAIAALMQSDAEAAGLAGALPDEERAQVAERIAAHADELLQLAAQAPDAAQGDNLRRAAVEVGALALAVRDGSPVPGATPVATAAAVTSSTPPATPAMVIVPTRVAPSQTAAPTAVTKPLPTITAIAGPTWTPRPRLRSTVTPPPDGTWTRVAPRSSETPRPRARLTLTPRLPRVTPALTSLPSPVITFPPTPAITVPPTRVIPVISTPGLRRTPIIPTGLPGTAAVSTPTRIATPAIPTVLAPTIGVPTIVVPTIVVPTVVAPTARPSVVWVTFTPGPTMTPRPEIRLTVILTVTIPQSPTWTPGPADTPQPATDVPGPTATPQPATEVPGPTPTPEEAQPTQTTGAQETAIPEATPTLPPRPR